jgi:2',5'-phosphodiesterase
MESEEMELASLDSSYSPSYWADSEHLNNSAIYWPTIEDLNRTLVLKCTPYDPSTNRYGNPVYCYTPGVESGPQLMSIRKRQEMTPFLLPHGSMRVISYNILADQHATTDYSRDILYPYCSQEALSSPYRHGLLVNELIGYNADIVCLQEVAMKSFDVSLLPVLNEQGYDGHYAMKTGQLHEGEAIFFHTSKYTSISSHVISLRKFFSEDPECAELFIELQKSPVIVTSIMDKPTILQVVVLQVTGYSERYLVVANTHLSFHPSEDHIRLFQAILCTKAINKIIREFKDSHLTSCDVAVIFCGDFNSCPCTGGYEYLTKGFLPACHPDWTKYKYSLIPRCGCCKVPTSDQDYIINALAMTGEKNLVDPSSVVIIDDFKGIDIKHELSLQDACGPLEYTHYRNVFVAVLDYILTDLNYFTVSNVVSMPTHDEVTQHTALPSVCFPSDHLALICELTWKVNI